MDAGKAHGTRSAQAASRGTENQGDNSGKKKTPRMAEWVPRHVGHDRSLAFTFRFFDQFLKKILMHESGNRFSLQPSGSCMQFLHAGTAHTNSYACIY